MPACTQPECIGTIVDGYCDVCGSPAGAVPFAPAAASATSPAAANEAGLTATQRGTGFPPKPRSGNLATACSQPGCTGMILDGYCDVCGSPADAVPFVPTATLAAAAPSAADDEALAHGKTNPAAQEYRTRVEQAQLPDDVRVAALREVDKLERTIAQTAECRDIRIWLDTILELPWGTKATDWTDDIQGSREIEATLQGLIKPAAAEAEEPETAESETAEVEPAVAEADTEEDDTAEVEEPATAEVEPAVAEVEEPDTVDLEPAVAEVVEPDIAEVEPAVADTEEPDTVDLEPAVAEFVEPDIAEVEPAVADTEEPDTVDLEPAVTAVEEPDTVDLEPAVVEPDLEEDDAAVVEQAAAEVQKPATAKVEPAATAVQKPDSVKVEPAAAVVDKPNRAPAGPRDVDTIETPAVVAAPNAIPQPGPQLPEQQVVAPVQVQAPAKKRRRSGPLVLAAAALVAVLIGGFFVVTRDDSGGAQSVPTQSVPAQSVPTQSVPTQSVPAASATVSTPTTQPTGTSQGGSPIQVRLPAPGKAFQAVPIRGTYRGGADTLLRVQREEEGVWVDFPTPAVTDASGKFSTFVELGQAGRYRLRVLDPATGITSATFVLVIEG